MIVDESTTIKNHKAIRTKNVLKLASYSKYRRILTGSPVTKSPLDLYTQCNFLDDKHLGFSSFYTFRNRYCVTHKLDLGGGKYTEIPKYYVHIDELEDKLSKFSYRVTKDECLDLPKKLYSKRYIDKLDNTDMLIIHPALPINITPKIIVLKDLPLDMLTIKAPTIGANAIHHAQ